MTVVNARREVRIALTCSDINGLARVTYNGDKVQVIGKKKDTIARSTKEGGVLNKTIEKVTGQGE